MENKGGRRLNVDTQTQPSYELEMFENKGHICLSHSHLEMGKLDGPFEHEFEDECCVGPSPLIRNNPSPEIENHNESFSNAVEKCSISYLKYRVFRSLNVILFSAKINLLMPCGPAAIVVKCLTGNHGWVFLLSLLGVVPLAERLGFVTEQLAFFTGPTVGGLLNATFGNATELIISIYALKKGMIRVVQQSLLGSILSNMLLVLGCAFFCGGMVHSKKDQAFNKAAVTVNSGLLLMAVMGLLFPAVLHFTHTEIHLGKSELALSRFSSCIMLVAYASYIIFQLRGQNSSYDGDTELLFAFLVRKDFDSFEIKMSASFSCAQAVITAFFGFLLIQGESQKDEDEEVQISKGEAIFWLAIVTIWISVLSEYLVDAIEGASNAWNMPIAFISVILLPIVGNAAEHASAIMFAMKDKLDISLGVAIGSSTQISMFGIPFCVVIGWIMERHMDLNFQLFETAALFITVLVVAFMLQDGTSNYFKGVMLILSYIIVAASFYVHVDPTSEENSHRN